MRNIPKPEIRFAEFQFKLEYKLNGKLFVVEDTLVCEYKGVNRWNENGANRVYDKYLESNKEARDIILCNLENDINVYYYTGYPALYMGDAEDKKKEDFNAVYSAISDDPSVARKFYNNKSYEDLGIELIGWTIASPIENNFQ